MKWSGTFLLLFGLGLTSIKAQIFDVDTLQFSGSTSAYINFVILGDGYTAAQQDKFESDALAFRNYFFNQPPYFFYKNHFNVFIIKVPSPQSGVKHPHAALDCPDSMAFADPANYFGSTFDRLGIHRLVGLKNTAKIGEVLSVNFPEYDQVVLLANSSDYGGSGGPFPVATVNAASNEIAIHEIGHSFANLADEYWAGAGYALESANRTQESSPQIIKWKNWIGLNGIGVYSYGGKAPLSGWFRPHEYCKMQYLGYPFCSVCSETIIEKIHSLVNPVIRTYPSEYEGLIADSIKRFVVELVKPMPNTLKTQWFLNDQLIAVNTDSILINPGVFANETTIIRFQVVDTSNLLRSDEHFTNHSYTQAWTVHRAFRTVASPKLRWNPVEVCHGRTTALSVANPQQGIQYYWYADSAGRKMVGQGANFTTPAITEDAAYFVQAFTGTKWSTRKKVSVKVLPVPDATPNIVADDAVVCYGASTRLKVKPGDSLLNYRWYTSETDLRSMGEDSIMMTPTLTSETAYFVSPVSKTTGCSGKRTKIVIAVMRQPRPLVTVSRINSSSIRLNWKPVDGAIAYKVSVDGGLSFQIPNSGTKGLYHTIEKLKRGEKLNLVVQAIRNGLCSLTSNSEMISTVVK